MDPNNDRHPYQFGVDSLVAGAGVTPDEMWSTEVVARHAEDVTKGLTIIHRGRAQVNCRQMKWATVKGVTTTVQCDWSRWIEGRTDYLSRRARGILATHLRAEHKDLGDEGIRLRLRVTTDTLHDWSPGVRQFSE